MRGLSMNDKIGRNAPCPCGSGRKYKHCCMGEERKRERRQRVQRMAVQKALDWLYDHHELAIARWADEEYCGCLDQDEVQRITRLNLEDEGFHQFFSQNMCEFLLCDGRLRIGRRKVPVIELLLGPDGPLMSVEQRCYLEMLCAQPLRLYEIQDVQPGVGFWLLDMLTRRGRRMMFVRERAASRELHRWDTLGARLIVVDDHVELSGALYPIPREHANWLVDTLRSKRLPSSKAARKREIGHWIVDTWLHYVGAEPEIPEIVDAATGEPVTLVTDHYQVHDWAQLERCLASQPDVDGDRGEGWLRICPVNEHKNRVLASIQPKGDNRLTLFTRTLGRADEQRRWLETLAGEAIAHRTREIADPVAMMRAGVEPRASDQETGIPEEVQRELKHTYMQEHYEKWLDTPLPALDGQTPRQAAATPDGRERLIRLLKDMELHESRTKHPFDFSFLWHELGLKR
ncbi:MAG: DUF2384 domain-containing protein [Zetaproteobacteria bacterium]|nr:MAG: DUF2384 domain-containing protein [Zetaproteobacteria bacterium]